VEERNPIQSKIKRVGVDAAFLKILVYGKSGVGKTVFSSTAPKPLFINADRSLLSVADKKVDAIDLNNFLGMNEIFWYLQSGKHPYKTVVLDGFGEIQKKSMDTILRNVVKAKPSRDPDIPSKNDWGKNTEQLRKVVRAFRDLPMHVIFTCLERVEKDENDIIESVSPAVTPRLGDDLESSVDIIGYLFVQSVSKGSTEKGSETEKKVVRRLLVQPFGKFLAKDRSGTLGDVIDEPTFPKILDLVIKGKKQKTKEE